MRYFVLPWEFRFCSQGIIRRGKSKGKLHRGKDAHKVIAEMNEVIKPALHLVDGVKTLTKANELRHGGKFSALGCILVGSDPVSLDALGLELLRKVALRLRRKQVNEVLHLRYAIELGLGDPAYEVVE